MHASLEPGSNSIEESWRYGRHHVHRERSFYIGDDGDIKMDVAVTIDGWEKFVFYHDPTQQDEVLKLLPYLDAWDRTHK